MNVNVVTLIFFSLWHQTTALFDGDDCTIPALQAKGLCIAVQSCDYAVALLKAGKRPLTCGFSGTNPLVCCPFPSYQNLNEKPGVLTQKVCDDYYDKKRQVYGIDFGEKARSKEFPHMAAVGYVDQNANIKWLCGGSLISHFFILSAAHCIESQDYGPAKWIRLGDLDLNDTTEDANPTDLNIIQAYAHPLYKPPSHYHDIALFKTKRIFFGIYFKAACLHISKKLPVDDVQVTGWGQLGILGDSSSHLMKAKLKLVSHETCARKFATVSNRKLKNGIVDQHQMCAGDAMGRDTCPGDSGGPLHYWGGGGGPVVEHFVVAGITSFGKGCGGENSVGVYTRVSAYIEWIESIVWREGD